MSAMEMSATAGFRLTAHRRVFAAFFLYSFGFGGFFPRLAEIQRDMGVAEGALGLALTGTAAGTLFSLTFAGPWVERFGHRRTLLWGLPIVPVCYAAASFAPGPLAMFLCLLPAGVCIGAIELVVNLEADRVEHLEGRRIMNRAHAFWSFGFFGAALIGAGAAQAGLSPQEQLIGMVALVAAGVVLLLARFEAAPHRPGGSGDSTPHFSRPTAAIMVLVIVSLPALVLEGAGFDWSAIYMRDVFAAAPFITGAAVAVGALSQAVTRYVADRFVERHSAVGVARTMLMLLGVGDLIVFIAPHEALAMLGFAMMGVGSSVIFPLAMSAAAQRTDRPAAVNVAALAQIAFVAFLLAPPLLGFVAEHVGIRWTFGVALPLVVMGLWWASAIGRRH
jgi:MFS family permease